MRVERVALTLAISLVIVEVAYYIALKYERETQHVQEEQVVLQEVQEVQEVHEKINFKEKLIEVIEEVEEETKQEVFFTSYYIGDGSSTNRTGSGLTTDMFSINENGWYVYDGYVVLATATIQGLESDYGVLKAYNEPNEHITYYSYGDVVSFEINGKEYQGLIADTCGASHDYDYLSKVDNGTNRIDIFVAEKQYSVGKVKGYIKKENRTWN